MDSGEAGLGNNQDKIDDITSTVIQKWYKTSVDSGEAGLGNNQDKMDDMVTSNWFVWYIIINGRLMHNLSCTGIESCCFSERCMNFTFDIKLLRSQCKEI